MVPLHLGCAYEILIYSIWTGVGCGAMRFSPLVMQTRDSSGYRSGQYWCYNICALKANTLFRTVPPGVSSKPDGSKTSTSCKKEWNLLGKIQNAQHILAEEPFLGNTGNLLMLPRNSLAYDLLMKEERQRNGRKMEPGENRVESVIISIILKT